MARNRKKQWSKTIEVQGVDVRLYERARGASVYFSYVDAEGNKVQKSTKREDRQEAEIVARAAVRRVVEDDLRVQRGEDPLHASRRNVTLGQLFKLYRREKLPGLSDQWGQAAEMRMGLFLEAWGKDFEVVNLSQSHVDAFARARMAGKLSPLGDGGQGDRDPMKVRAGTVDADFRWLSSALNFARRHKLNGDRVLSENPLHDLEWPKEKNPRRPVASHQRYVATQEHTDAVDPEGRLCCILALARWTGRRESAICELRAPDVLRDAAAIRKALAAAGMDERIAEHMPYGAIRWSDASDKQGFLFISPMSSDAREELDRYLRRSPRVGDVPLFPAPEDPESPIRRDTAATWLLRAEKAAKLPKLTGGTFHPYRRLWATERKHLPAKDVAHAGGWKDTRALELSYQHADPETVLRVVQGG